MSGQHEQKPGPCRRHGTVRLIVDDHLVFRPYPEPLQHGLPPGLGWQGMAAQTRVGLRPGEIGIKIEVLCAPDVFVQELPATESRIREREAGVEDFQVRREQFAGQCRCRNQTHGSSPRR